MTRWIDATDSQSREALRTWREDRAATFSAPRTVTAAAISDADLFIELIGAVAEQRRTDDEVWVRYGVDISRDACRTRGCVLFVNHEGACL